MKSKKIISVILSFLIVCMILLGCNSGKEDKSTDSKDAKETKEEKSTDSKEVEADKSDDSEETDDFVFKLEEVKTDEEKELIFWHNRGGSAGELLEKTLIPEFNEGKGKEMGINIVPVFQDDLIGKLKTLLLADDTENLPDLVQAFAGDVEYLSTVEEIQPIEDFINADNSFNKDDIFPILLNTYSYGDIQLGLPFHASTMIMFYNKTAFEESGLDPEKYPTTIAELASIAPDLMKTSGDKINRYAITMSISNTYLNHFIGGQGEFSYIGNNENGRSARMTEVTFDKDGTMEKFLTEWKKVLDTETVQTQDDGSQARDEFQAGTSAVLFSSNNVLNAMYSSFEERGWELGIAPLPKVTEEDSGGTAPGGSGIYIMNKGDSQSMAKSWEFIKWWQSEEVQTTWALGVGCIPTNSKTVETDQFKEYVETHPGFTIAYDQMMNSHPNIQEHLAPTQQAFMTVFAEEGQKFESGSQDVATTVANMAERCNQALDDFNRANP